MRKVFLYIRRILKTNILVEHEFAKTFDVSNMLRPRLVGAGMYKSWSCKIIQHRYKSEADKSEKAELPRRQSGFEDAVQLRNSKFLDVPIKKKSWLKHLIAYLLLTPTLAIGLGQDAKQTRSLIHEGKFKLIKSINTASSFFTTDNLGNSYLINSNVLEKYDADGNPVKNFSNKNLGDITFIDATNPFKVLVFYKSFQQIILLDNMFFPSGNSISLEALGYNQVSLACSSHNNGFWIYNQQNFELIRFNQGLQKTVQTGNLARLIGTEINPDFIIEQNNKTFLNNPETGIMIFDIYGTYSKTIPLKGLHNFQISNDIIIYFKDRKLRSYNTTTLEENETFIPEAEALDAQIEKEKLYLLKQKSLDIYKLQ